MMQTIIACVITAVVALAIGFPAGIQWRKKVAEKEISSAEEEAKRIINAGIQRVVIRNTETEYSVVHVEDWIREDDSLPEQNA